MKEYLVNVVVCAFFMGVCKMITPQGVMKRQAESVIALMVIVVLISPVISMNESFEEFYQIPDLTGKYEYNPNLNKYIETEQIRHFETAMNDYLIEVIYREYEVYIKVRVKAKTDEKGTIMGVGKVYIYTDNQAINSIQSICEMICSELGIRRDDVEVK